VFAWSIAFYNMITNANFVSSIVSYKSGFPEEMARYWFTQILDVSAI
jgi:hypothetical protein